MEVPSGQRATCRFLQTYLQRYTCAPWDGAFKCLKGHLNMVPYVTRCRDFEREPGTD
jgi:hypothetical protein